MDAIFIFDRLLMIIGAATIMFRAIEPLTKLTKTKLDDGIVTAILDGLLSITRAISLNKTDETIIVKVKRK